MSVNTKLRKAGVVAAVTTTALLAASPAWASVSATAWNGNSSVALATGTGVNTSYGHAVRGTLYDMASWDGRCARVYSRGYNYFLGYSGAQIEATVCSGGYTGYQTESYWTYGDKVQIKVCAGYMTTYPTQCSGWITAG